MTELDKTKKVVKKSSRKGVVVSDKMLKTIVVRVDTLKEHPKYKKRYISSKKYKVHDPEDKYQVGDVVKFVSCKPMSKGKKWIVTE